MRPGQTQPLLARTSALVDARSPTAPLIGRRPPGTDPLRPPSAPAPACNPHPKYGPIRLFQDQDFWVGCCLVLVAAGILSSFLSPACTLFLYGVAVALAVMGVLTGKDRGAG